MKTPDEIKKALACDCDGPDCEGCVYAEKVIDEEFGELTRYHCSQIYKDALEYIQQLESRLAQAERERDAAVHDLEELTTRVPSWHLDCDYCKEKDKPVCENCEWQWRGVCEENAKEEK